MFWGTLEKENIMKSLEAKMRMEGGRVYVLNICLKRAES